MEQALDLAHPDGARGGGDSDPTHDGDERRGQRRSTMRPMLVDKLTDRDGNTVVQYKAAEVRKVIGTRRPRKWSGAHRGFTKRHGAAGVAGKLFGGRQNRHGTDRRKPAEVTTPGSTLRRLSISPCTQTGAVIGVFVDEPHNGYYGGVAAGPAFREIAEKTANYLSIEPSVPVKSLAEPKAELARR